MPSGPMGQQPSNMGQNEAMSKFGFAYEQPPSNYEGQNLGNEEGNDLMYGGAFQIFGSPGFEDDYGANNMNGFGPSGWNQGK